MAQVLRHLPPGLKDPNVLVGLDAPDDAGVYKLTDEIAIVQTVDFFTPIVDDPYAFGQIAAANALSDVYAMGGRPITVLNLVGFPISKLPHSILAEILRGGADKAREAGAVILGGHSIDDPEPKYGMAVTGIVHPDRLGVKAGAQPGDQLVLTKPIGVGTLTTAIKRGVVPAEVEAEVVKVMSKLNNVTAVLEPFNISGMTDVTGFGLLGHASEMAGESKVGMRIYASKVPVIPAAWEYARQGIWPGGTVKNQQWLGDKLEFDPALDETFQLMLCDAVTSGGLLIAVAAGQTEALVTALQQAGTLVAAVIGDCVADHPGRIHVLP